jgi:hypothetical protein
LVILLPLRDDRRTGGDRHGGMRLGEGCADGKTRPVADGEELPGGEQCDRRGGAFKRAAPKPAGTSGRGGARP